MLGGLVATGSIVHKYPVQRRIIGIDQDDRCPGLLEQFDMFGSEIDRHDNGAIDPENCVVRLATQESICSGRFRAHQNQVINGIRQRFLHPSQTLAVGG